MLRQSRMVAIFCLPLAVWHWQWPTPEQWAWFAFSGVLGSAGHYCLTRAFVLADLSVTQLIKFLELIWAVLMGLVIWGETPGVTTLVGGAVIFAATSRIARREVRGRGRGSCSGARRCLALRQGAPRPLDPSPGCWAPWTSVCVLHQYTTMKARLWIRRDWSHT